MLKKFIIAIVIVFFISGIVAAILVLRGAPKEVWLQEFKQKVPTKLCNVFLEQPGIKESMLSHNINYDQCVTLMPASVDYCVNFYYSSLPNRINPFTGFMWGSTIGRCVGGNFYEKNIGHTQKNSNTSLKR